MVWSEDVSERLVVIAVILEGIQQAQTETATWFPAADIKYHYTFIHGKDCFKATTECGDTYHGEIAAVQTNEEYRFLARLLTQFDRVTIGLRKLPECEWLLWINEPYNTNVDHFWMDPPGKPVNVIKDWKSCFCVAVQTNNLKWVTIPCHNATTPALCKRMVDACPDGKTNCRNNPNAVCDDSGTCNCKPGYYNTRQCNIVCPPSACISTPCTAGSTCYEKCERHYETRLLVSSGYECIAAPTTASTTITTTTTPIITANPTTATTTATTKTTGSTKVDSRITSKTTPSKTTRSKTTRSTTETTTTVDSIEGASPQNTGGPPGSSQGAIFENLPAVSGANRLLKRNPDCLYELCVLMNVILMYCLYLNL